ncbi:sugar ABC transporter substrate-binding protein [Streptomyces sp. SHP 1-2]|uniref:sugar ABC transporter substrate-binding protein n=1 Tax=Streptomyces sp. SHP 1-2 TaxID=2769489 RepID=UPI002238987A|nr:substrate-binding domain-containing protein [Streptomyces sp. SHP 1-2]MCW5253177.1 substrate-binding domain-containing protein [Streptomyces sp. SHP 1-2]
MNTSRTGSTAPPPRRRGLRLAGALLAGAVLLGAAGCGSPEAASGSGSGKAGSSQAGTTARTALADLMKPVDSLPKPGPPVNTRAAAGKTVFYVPIALKVGHFPLVQKNLTTAFERVGVRLHSCDGQGTPSGISACLDQAVAQKPAAVITDYVPYELVPTTFEKVRASGIPVYVAGTAAPEGVRQSAGFAFGDPDVHSFTIMDGLADAVIADSDGAARVLFLKVMDSASTRRAADRAVEHFRKACPDCRVAVKEVGLSTMKDVPSLVSSALLTDPAITHVVPEYDTYLSAVVTGLQSVGRTRDVKIATTGATLATVQQLRSDDRLLAVVGVNPPYLGWTMADATLRMLDGEQPPATYPVLARAFTKDTVDGLALNPKDEVSGRWFGDPAAYQDVFTGLWGAR